MKPRERLLEDMKARTKKIRGCWIWQGSKRGRPALQYGYVKHKGKAYGAHRLMWELTNQKKIPKGMFACHHCDNPSCIKPDHIFIGTPSDNSKDAYKKGRLKPPDLTKPTCLKGHPKTPENLYYVFCRTRNKIRTKCRACRVARYHEKGT